MCKTMLLTSLLVALSMSLAGCASPTALPIQPTLTPLPTPVPTPGIGSTMTRAKDGMAMVFVPEGSFTMGSDEFRDAKAHTVTLGSYWIDQTEMTNSKYELCVKAGACKAPNGASTPSYASYFVDPKFSDYPVVYVDWYQAKTYCEWAGAKLPTEAEWEKAARGTDGRTYPWGENIDETYANYTFNPAEMDPIDTTKVGSFEKGKSPYGAYDMAGNVYEWVSSQYGDYPYSATDGREDLNATNVYRVLRGGGWWFKADEIRSAFRYYTAPDLNDAYAVGFRCASSSAP